MTDADSRLKALFAEDEPPARDPVFSTAVMEELARRRFVADMALIAALAVGCGFALWLAWPRLAPVWPVLAQGLAPLGACATLAIGAVMLLDGRIPAARRNHG
ncbi:hypothetical protein [Phenylobacterium sp.]|uniref:hypothetical protein n=1 Tax=Phenylobacterium sp. TaxID=1871053 RepID=UPI0025DE17F3|nr:hypothetical protein [Phenylobacterium sp.]